MRVLLQRVSDASVSVDEIIKGKINQGILILVGFEDNDNFDDLEWLVQKLLNLRIFEEKMSKSILDVQGDLLIISQFTLFASTKKGTRPSFSKAGSPEFAKKLYHQFIDMLKIKSSLKVESGIFGADMKVQLVNDGPVSIIIDSKNRE